MVPSAKLPDGTKCKVSTYIIIIHRVKYTFVGEKIRKLLAANNGKMPIFGRSGMTLWRSCATEILVRGDNIYHLKYI